MAKDEKLTGEKAHNLYNEKGRTQSQIAEKYGVSQSYVSQLISGYESGLSKGREKGKEEADPSAFDRETLADALSDKENSEDLYDCHNCSNKLEYMEAETCPECDARLNWSAVS